MSEHILKTYDPYWWHVSSGAKTFEVRRNDRGFRVDDILVLQSTATGKELRRRVTYILDGGVFGIADGYVVMAIEPEAEAP